MHEVPIIISNHQMLEQLDNPNLLIIAVCAEAVFNDGHIPGSVLLTPASLICGEKPAVGKLPSVEKLTELFEQVGLTDKKHVVVYDDEGGGWAGRLIWTLDVIGHSQYSYIDGGLVAWKELGFPLEQNTRQLERSSLDISIDPTHLVSIEDIVSQIDDENSVVWDARSKEEYLGTKITAEKNGHIPNAVNLDWLDLMDSENGLRLKPLADIKAELHKLGIDSGKSVITHCQTHHRSGLTYLVGKVLGYSIKAYDGSWAEWGNNPVTPVES